MSVSPDFCTGGFAIPAFWKDPGTYCSYGNVVGCAADGTATFVRDCEHGCLTGQCVMVGPAHDLAASLSLLFLLCMLWWMHRH
jgi:hypothetical protein